MFFWNINLMIYIDLETLKYYLDKINLLPLRDYFIYFLVVQIFLLI